MVVFVCIFLFVCFHVNDKCILSGNPWYCSALDTNVNKYIERDINSKVWKDFYDRENDNDDNIDNAEFDANDNDKDNYNDNGKFYNDREYGNNDNHNDGDKED